MTTCKKWLSTILFIAIGSVSCGEGKLLGEDRESLLENIGGPAEIISIDFDFGGMRVPLDARQFEKLKSIFIGRLEPIPAELPPPRMSDFEIVINRDMKSQFIVSSVYLGYLENPNGTFFPFAMNDVCWDWIELYFYNLKMKGKRGPEGHGNELPP